MNEQQVIVITGMHRSGTSLVASLLQKAGLHIGTQLQGPSQGNWRGHFEDSDFYNFHEQCLKERGLNVFWASPEVIGELRPAEMAQARSLIEQRRERQVWGWKDPRTTLFLDFWHDLLPNPRYLFVYRHPLEIVLSLLRRGTDLEMLVNIQGALQSWQIYNQKILDFYLLHPESCLLSHISSLTDNITGFIDLVAEQFGLDLDSSDLLSIYRADELQQGLVSPEADDLLNKIFPKINNLYAQMESHANLPGTCTSQLTDHQIDQLLDLTERLSNPLKVEQISVAKYHHETISPEIPSENLLKLLQILDPQAIGTAYGAISRLITDEPPRPHPGTLIQPQEAGNQSPAPHLQELESEFIESNYDEHLPQASIIIVTFNNLEYTRLCLQSIYNKTTSPNFEIIIIDNASSDGTPQFLKQFASNNKNIRILLNNLNVGFARATNLGAKLAKGQYLIFLNNDTIVTKGWLSTLIYQLQDTQVGMVGPVTNYSGNETRIKTDYETISDIDEFANRHIRTHRGKVFELRMLPLHCVAIRRSVFDQAGPLDERFGLGMFEDDDYSLRVKLMGYKIICAEDAFIHHWGSAAFAQLDPYDYWKLFSQNRQKFEEKWKTKWLPHQYRSELISKQIGDLVEANIFFATKLAESKQDLRQITEEHQTQEALLEADKAHLLQKVQKQQQIIEEHQLQIEQMKQWELAFQTAESQLREQETKLQYQTVLLEEQQGTIDTQTAKLQEQENTLQHLNSTLEGIFSTRFWRVARWYWGVKETFFRSLLATLIRKAFHQLPASTRKSIFLYYSRIFQKSNSNDIVRDMPPPLLEVNSIKSLVDKNRSDVNDQRVLILTPTFFDFDGNNMFSGGAERYLIELTDLILELGYEPEVYQCANSCWDRYYGHVRVTGIDVNGDLQRLNEAFHRQVSEGILTIYFAFYLAKPKCHKKSIGISHGVFWDAPSFQAPLIRSQKIKDILEAIKNLEYLVSVDTNTINWVRSTDSSLAEKFSHIPNFVDLQQFRMSEQNKSASKIENDQGLIILYPRRLYTARGFWLVAEIVSEILKKHSNLEFHFVGKADAQEEIAITKLCKEYPTQIQWYSLPPEQMHKAYQRANITLIPTMHSEGTSLSCLEALASGNAVIATNVGGLSDLIISGFNGLLVEPTAMALKMAIEQLIEDEQLRLRLSQNGVEVAKAFSLGRWRDSWQKILHRYLPVPKSALNNYTKIIVFPLTPGISWEPIKQRPHHIAVNLASQDIEVFWTNDGERKPNIKNNLHIIGRTDDIYLKEPIVYIYYPYNYAKIEQFEQFGPARVIYDVLDDISIYDSSDKQNDVPPGMRARDYQQKLFKRADIVITSSQHLLNEVQQHRSDAIFVPNGVDPDHLMSDGITPAFEISRLQNPVIGFHGAIAEWLDYELLVEVVQLRPKYQFVFLGSLATPGQFEVILDQPNVCFFPEKPYEQLPGYIAGFDVGILPFKITPLTKGVRPLKVLEYLAMKKPVVATPLPDLFNWPGVFLAETPEEFANSLDSALEVRASILSDSKIETFVNQYSWTQVVEPLVRAIEELR